MEKHNVNYKKVYDSCLTCKFSSSKEVCIMINYIFKVICLTHGWSLSDTAKRKSSDENLQLKWHDVGPWPCATSSSQLMTPALFSPYTAGTIESLSGVSLCPRATGKSKAQSPELQCWDHVDLALPQLQSGSKDALE